ncbi:MAG: hypothetical protein KIT59_10095 [Nitrosomonas sp.]|nr:hypothetical protein [Nitrosomonas sp.]
MFDLLKDIDKYGGIPPYASELYGVYQPLLGWQSQLTKRWLQRGGVGIEPRVKRILDGHIKPGPTDVRSDHTREMIALPLEPGSGRSPFIVLLTRSLHSELMKLMRVRVQTFVDANNGRLPDGVEWIGIVDINNLMDASAGDLRRVNDVVRERLFADAVRRTPDGQLTGAMTEEIRKTLLEVMQYESQVAAFLLFYAEGQQGRDPNTLKTLFDVKKATPLSDILRPVDPLSMIDPNDRSGALSPVGFVHLFRQYFFNLGTFLGEPVEHVWLAPGTTIELVEVSTRRVLVERMLEEMAQTTTNSEKSATFKDEISDAVKEANQTSTKLGVSQSNTVNLYVYQGTVSANFGIESTRSISRETTHKQNREQTEKLSSEIKQSFKSVFRTVTETTDLRSRRHVITNPGNKLVNYELRRKMRRVGVQVQDIGMRLCWQVFVDDPGAPLGLAELVDMVEAPDISSLKEPEKIPEPAAIVKKAVVPIPFLPILDYTNNNAHYEYAYIDPPGARYAGKHLSLIQGVEDEDDRDDQTIMGPFEFTMDPPQSNYALSDVRMVGVQGNKIADIRDRRVLDSAKGRYEIIMQRIHYGGENVVNLDMELVFTPTDAERKRVSDANATAATKYDADKAALMKKSYLQAVRDRIRDASKITARPSWDLREEERTVVYRKLIERLMLDSWKSPDSDANRRLSHVRSEIVRSIFDVDSMLYFVAPEWWMPRRRKGQIETNIKMLDKPFALADDDVVRWGGEKRPDNYRITEESAQAKLGSSLGWLLQLDGDNLRNAFLNAPWVKAVIPIRPGRETAALNWLRVIEGHENDGWDTPYLGAEAEFAGMKIGEVLEIIADRLQKENEDIQNVLAADKVFEKGFDHLAGGFAAGLDANEVFSQWISVLPTDQIVAVEYEPTDMQVP